MANKRSEWYKHNTGLKDMQGKGIVEGDILKSYFRHYYDQGTVEL